MLPTFSSYTTTAPGTPFAPLGGSRPVEGDFNGDGLVDLAFTLHDDPTGQILSPLQIFLGQSDGTYQIGNYLLNGDPVMTGYTGFILVADFNDDGRSDLYLATYGNEIGGGGDRDIVLLTQPDGTFRRAESPALQVNTYSHGSTIGDADGDGDVDIFQSGIGDVRFSRLLLNDGAGNFIDGSSRLPDELAGAITRDVMSSTLVDVNGDGRNDLVVGHTSGPQFPGGLGRVYIQGSDGNFTPSTILPAGSFPSWNTDTAEVTGADIDGDGDNDLLFANFSGGLTMDSDGNLHWSQENMEWWRDIQLFINDGSGNFTDQSSRLEDRGSNDGVTKYAMKILVADLNYDGFPDLIADSSTDLMAQQSGTIAWLNDGAGNFEAYELEREIAKIQSFAYAIFTFDADGDGDKDLGYGSDGLMPGSDTERGPSFQVQFNLAAPAFQLDHGSIKLVAATYQFFTDKIPSVDGFAYLISSSTNPDDLNDEYYGQFNIENRYINFASNLGTAGEGAIAFDSEFGGLSYEQTVRIAYQEITGKELSGGALSFFLSAQGFYEAVASERVVRPGVDLAEATKIVAIGSILNEAIKGGEGPYSDAIDAMIVDLLADGRSDILGGDLFSFS